MNRILRGVFCAFICILSIPQPIVAKVPIPTTDQASQLRSDLYSHDFGVVNRRVGDISHDFTIENGGTSPIVITRIVSSCSCMKASVSRKPLGGDESRTLRITYELKKMPPGHFSKSVLIYTSDSTIPLRFTLSGQSSYTTRKEYKRSL